MTQRINLPGGIDMTQQALKLDDAAASAASTARTILHPR